MICTFRTASKQAFKAAFVSVLQRALVCVSYNLKRLFALKNLAIVAENRRPNLSLDEKPGTWRQ